jgi:bacillaene synthase trans-acting acyltransferase
MMPAIWMFGGQGSQYYQMGRDLYASDDVFRRAVRACSDILEPVLHASLIDEIYRPRDDRFAPFDRLLYANPAICAVQYGVAEALRARGCRPDYVLGYSLGTITAQIVAGALALEDGLRMAVKLAELTEDRVLSGGMLAVLKAPEPFDGAWIAARNFATHFVLAAESETLAAIEQRLAAERVSIQRLPVRYPFHCPLIDPIADDFAAFVAAVPQRTPTVDVLAPRSVWDAIRQPVDFQATVCDLEARGGWRYVDLGPSATLATFVKYNRRPGSPSEIFSTVTPFDRAAEHLDRLSAPPDARRFA